MEIIKQSLDRLLHPFAHLEDRQQLSNAILSDRLMLSFVLVIGAILAYYRYRGNSFDEPDFSITFVCWLLTIIFLILGRIIHYRVGTLLWVSLVSVLSILTAFIPGSQANLLYFAILPVLLTAIFYRPIAVTRMSILVVVSTLALHLLAPSFSFLVTSPDIIPMIIYLILVNAIIAVYTNHAQVLEKLRRDELEEVNQALRQSETTLEQRVKERTQELALANQQLEELAKVKDTFVSNVSHELKTPIASMQVNYDLLSIAKDKRDVYMGRMSREITRLNGLIEDILRLSRLDQGQTLLRLEKSQLNDIVRSLVEDRTPLIHAHNLQLDLDICHDLSDIHLDRGLIEQVISILLTNATNYTPAGGHISIRTFQDNENVGFSVTDTGPGISEEDGAHLFERFFRGSAAIDGDTPGTGLGLAIAKEIVDRHGGKIVCKSVLSRGSTFSVYLPIHSS